MTRDDRELWQRVGAGDADAFAVLYDRYQALVYRFCFRRTADWGRAEDLTSAVFLEAWRKRRRIRLHDDRLGPWLLGVATNVVRNDRRSLRRYSDVLARIPPLQPENDFAGELGDRLDAAARAAELIERVRGLPRREQEVVALQWEGLTTSEMAAALRTTQAAVRSRMSRARRRLGSTAATDVPAPGSRASIEGSKLL
jgi:RNA polymerase sigma-70 factor (ECF subfamily)